MCDLAVQKAFRALVTGVRKRFPPGGEVALLCYVDKSNVKAKNSLWYSSSSPLRLERGAIERGYWWSGVVSLNGAFIYSY